jgi:hypothetical protein
MGYWDYSVKDVEEIMAKGERILSFIKRKKWVRVTSREGRHPSLY